MINFPLINFLSLSSNLSSNQNYLQEHERKKKKKKRDGNRSIDKELNGSVSIAVRSVI